MRDLHRLLVSAVARNSGIDHRRLNAELIARTGSRVDQATVEQLQKRLAQLMAERQTPQLPDADTLFKDRDRA